MHAHIRTHTNMNYTHIHAINMQADSDDEDPMVRYGAMPEVGSFSAGPAASEDEAGPSAAPGLGAASWQLSEQQHQQQQQQHYEGAYDYSQYGQQYEGVQQGPVPEQYEAGAYYVGAQPEYAGGGEVETLNVYFDR